MKFRDLRGLLDRFVANIGEILLWIEKHLRYGASKLVFPPSLAGSPSGVEIGPSTFATGFDFSRFYCQRHSF